MFDFTDDFDSLDTNRWTKGAHNLGRSSLDPNNVSTSNGNLQITHPANSLRGGEVIPNNLYGYGSYTAHMKLSDAASSITGFFLYEPPDYDSEIDIEIYNDAARKIMFSTYSGGKQTRTQTLKLPFNPTNGFHDYRFDYAPGFVKFFVNGQLMKHWTTGIPDNSMKLYVNAWYPN